jgi:hypothetical protein
VVRDLTTKDWESRALIPGNVSLKMLGIKFFLSAGLGSAGSLEQGEHKENIE